MSERSFFAELERRNVYRAAAFYAAASWLLVQIATQMFPFFDSPNWSVRLVVIAVIVGFPFAVLFLWFYELTPQGIKLESAVDRSESIVASGDFVTAHQGFGSSAGSRRTSNQFST
jgi:hypothetical protein